jgi:glycosyltransferase involved in cell wall biosynthesis
MRYAWDWRKEVGRIPAPIRPAWPIIASHLRYADRQRARNVDLFLADSKNVASLIKRFYGRRSVVLYPPVDTDYFSPDDSEPREHFFLFAGRLVAYKRPELAVRAATALGARLIVAGSGPELSRLVAMSGPTVEFHTNATDAELRDLYRTTQALLLPGREDFGIIPVEAQACGAPVIALAEGGALETVEHRQSGLLYQDDSLDGLTEAMHNFENLTFEPATIRANAERFGTARFDATLRAIISALTGEPVNGRSALIDELLNEHKEL